MNFHSIPNAMQRSLLIIITLMLSAILVWLLLVWQPGDGRDRGIELQSVPKGGDFTLNSYRGAVSLRQFQGNAVVLYFGYTWCPDICPSTLALISAALEEMSEAERARVQPLFVSVDPARDRVERLKEYVEYFHPKLIGLTGDESVIAEVAKRYGAAYQVHMEEGQENYVVDHTADTYLIDADGRLVKTVPHGASVAELLSLVRALLD
jgi:protein SCO1/2